MADPTSPGRDAAEEATDPASDGEQTDGPAPEDPEADGPAPERTDDAGADGDLEALRERVESEYDFEEFGPEQMAEMSPEEWTAAFDADAWVTGPELLDRVEADLRSRVADRDVFAVVERTTDGRLVAYSDSSYAVVYPDGGVEGEGTVLQDVKPTVALASMPDYDVPEPPDDGGLPAPEKVGGTGGQLGNNVLQALSLLLGLAGAVLVVAPFVVDVQGATIIAVLVGFVFLAVAVVLLFTVANARLSARYRAEEFRERLRGAGVTEGDRPEFLPVSDAAFGDAPAVPESDGAAAEDGGGDADVTPDAERAGDDTDATTE